MYTIFQKLSNYEFFIFKTDIKALNNYNFKTTAFKCFNQFISDKFEFLTIFTSRNVYHWPKFTTFWKFKIFASQKTTFLAIFDENFKIENGSKICQKFIF